MATWTMTLLNLWDEVQIIAQDSTARWGSDERTALANSVIAQVARDTRSYMTTATASVVADQAQYDLPDACPSIMCIRRIYVDGNLAERLEGAELDKWERDGFSHDPGRTMWYARDGKVNFAPVPSSAIANGIVYHFAGLPETISADSDPIPLLADLHLAVVHGCAARMLSADGDGERARYEETLYKQEVGRFLAKGGEWQEPPQNRILDEDREEVRRIVIGS